LKILGIDTSNKIASVAVYDNENLLGEKFSDDQKTHSEKVLPLIDSLLKELNIEINQIDEFVVCTGPGSFTGIRIGVALIKGMAEGISKKVIGVTALEGLLNAVEGNACAIIDARHDNVYAQYRVNGVYSESKCININELLVELPKENITFVGDATIVHKELLGNINENILIQSASDLINYALKNNLEAKKPEEVNPVYLRKAQAER
jgi:tRNA threonylcarbamoyladenosine biosynthesis protein TsaB